MKARTQKSQSQEHGGHSQRQPVPLGELDRAVEGPQPISRISICAFIKEEQD